MIDLDLQDRYLNLSKTKNVHGKMFNSRQSESINVKQFLRRNLTLSIHITIRTPSSDRPGSRVRLDPITGQWPGSDLTRIPDQTWPGSRIPDQTWRVSGFQGGGPNPVLGYVTRKMGKIEFYLGLCQLTLLGTFWHKFQDIMTWPSS